MEGSPPSPSPSPSPSRSSSRTTVTQREQWTVEQQVSNIYNFFSELPRNAQSFMLEIQRETHLQYLINGLKGLSSSFCVLDANRPWLCYWILHSIALLGETIDNGLEDNTIDFLCCCQDLNGGYGGGPGQMPHLATTYAAVNSLITLGGDRALSSINRDRIYNFLRQMKQSCGGFRMHDGGEVDVRACYTAISVASILNILDDDLVKNVGDYIISCQTYEGGIAGEPGSEAHGGYTFCGLATMILINEAGRLDLFRLAEWVVFRQGVECGFQGRTNKLVDGCYSFWQGGACALLQRLSPEIREQLGVTESGEECATDTALSSDSSEEEDDSDGTAPLAGVTCQTQHYREAFQGAASSVHLNDFGYNFLQHHEEDEPLFNSLALQRYIILCSQLPEGGLRDKPGKSRDHYHTCYCLSGLSVSQHSWSVYGPNSNLLEPIQPLYNVVLSRYHEACDFFGR